MDQYVVLVLTDPASHYGSGFASGVDAVLGPFPDLGVAKITAADTANRTPNAIDWAWLDDHTLGDGASGTIEVRRLGERWTK